MMTVFNNEKDLFDVKNHVHNLNKRFAKIDDFILNGIDLKPIQEKVKLLKKDIVERGLNRVIGVDEQEGKWKVTDGIEMVMAIASLIKSGVLPKDYVIPIGKNHSSVGGKKVIGNPSLNFLDVPLFSPFFCPEYLFRENPVFTPHYKFLPISEQIELHIKILNRPVEEVVLFSVRRGIINDEGRCTLFAFDNKLPKKCKSDWNRIGGQLVYQLIEKDAKYFDFDQRYFNVSTTSFPIFSHVGRSFHFYLFGESNEYMLNEFSYLVDSIGFDFQRRDMSGLVAITRLNSDNLSTDAFSFFNLGLWSLSEHLIKFIEEYGLEDQSEYIISITPGSKEMQILAEKSSYWRQHGFDMQVGNHFKINEEIER